MSYKGRYFLCQAISACIMMSILLSLGKVPPIKLSYPSQRDLTEMSVNPPMGDGQKMSREERFVKFVFNLVMILKNLCGTNLLRLNRILFHLILMICKI